MKELGMNTDMQEFLGIPDISENEYARVIIEHKERYRVQTGERTFQAEITGNMRFTAESRSDFPAVGDWVKIMKMDEENVIIMEILPRRSLLERQAVGKHAQTQIIASNIDTAFITISIGHDFSINRMDRYLVLCHNGNVRPCILLTKTDLVDAEELADLKQQIHDRIPDVPLICLSSLSGEGYGQLKEFMEAYHSYCFLGSSGVGKSTIINTLAEKEVMTTNSISSSTSKGKHTTSHRELIILPNKSIVIDTAGMREIGMTDSEEGVDSAFSIISELAVNCRFSDCTHINESDCAVLEALQEGRLHPGLYDNYHRLKREQEYFSSTVAEKRQKDKEFGKMVKNVMNEKKKYKL